MLIYEICLIMARVYYSPFFFLSHLNDSERNLPLDSIPTPGCNKIIWHIFSIIINSSMVFVYFDLPLNSLGTFLEKNKSMHYFFDYGILVFSPSFDVVKRIP